MSAAKEAEARADREAAEHEDQLPAYEEFDSGVGGGGGGSSRSAAAPPPLPLVAELPAEPVPATLSTPWTQSSSSSSASAVTRSVPPTLSHSHHDAASKSAGPTISSPFDFPSVEDSPPSYASAAAAFSSNPSDVIAVAEASQLPAQDQKHHPHGYEWEQQQQMQQGQHGQQHGYEWEQQQQMQQEQHQQYQGHHPQGQQQQPVQGHHQHQRLIAIPQVNLTPAAPLADAYPHSLLAYGITPETWRSFLSTMSAFLSAKVGDIAVRHAADVGRSLAESPKRFSKDTADHARSIGNDIMAQAQSGNLVGAAMNAVGGAITLPVGTALRAVGAIVSLPGTAMRTAAQKPQTPRERAAVYAAAANKKWLLRRGLEAKLMDSYQLSAFVGVDTGTLCEATRRNLDPGADVAAQWAASGFLVPVEVGTRPEQLVLGEKTLWLVVVQCAIVPPPDKIKGKGKGKDYAGAYYYKHSRRDEREERREEKRKEKENVKEEKEREKAERDFMKEREKEEKRKEKEIKRGNV